MGSGFDRLKPRAGDKRKTEKSRSPTRSSARIAKRSTQSTAKPKTSSKATVVRLETTVAELTTAARPMEYRERQIFHIRAPRNAAGSIRDRNKLLNEEVDSSPALYRGVSTAYFLGSLADLSYPSSSPEKYSALGSGIYLTPSRDYAFTYANPGSVLVFKGLNDPKALERRPREGCSDSKARKYGRKLRVVQYKDTDKTWKRIVTANIQANRSGIPQPDYSRIPRWDIEEYFDADVIIAPVVANFDAIRRGVEEPKPEPFLEYVFWSS